MIDEAPTTSSVLSWRLPCLEIDRSFSIRRWTAGGRKAQPGGEVAAGLEALNVVDGRTDSCGDQRPTPGMLSDADGLVGA